MILCIMAYYDQSRNRTDHIKTKKGEGNDAQRAACVQTGGCCAGSFSGGVASLESQMLFDVYPKHGEVQLEAKAVFHF